MRDNTVGKVAFQFLRHTIASIFLITLFAETAFCNDFNIGPIGINDTWQLTDIDIGWSPVGGISVTGYIGSFALPVNDVYSGNWSDPTTWSLSNIVVLYDRAKAWQDFLTGQSGVEYSNGNVSFAWQGLTQGLGPTEQSVTFPIPLLDYSPIVNVNIGTKLEYNVTLSHNILLDQDATLNFLSVQPGARLDFQAGKSMVLRTGISENAGTITGAVLSIQDGGTLTNQGSFEWKGGSIGGSGGLTNQGSFTISGNGGQTVGYCIDAGWGYFAPGALTNSGTITHAADGVLHMVKDSTLNNLAGAVYD
ncbi:MAG: hypothetical protein NTW93_04605, partial [Phycisphaerae bacterium]|nr:hypothetical protein [Phycisphaerae bacterium]